MKIVTSGQTFTDIDAYAGCIAYAELLRRLGGEAVAVLPGALNESITATMRTWPAQYETTCHVGQFDEFVLIDISDPHFVSQFVIPEQVTEVIDHHMGFTDFWLQRGVKMQIEHIGAACTQVFEHWQHHGLDSDMPAVLARLLACGILDNTLNFNASVTHDRDRVAYRTLQGIANADDTFAEQYFNDCQASLMGDPVAAMSRDTKYMRLVGFTEEIAVGQLVLWDASQMLDQREALSEAMRQHRRPWFINLISISEGKNYLISDDKRLEVFLMQLLDTEFSSGLAHTSRLWLRKEILKQAIERNGA